MEPHRHAHNKINGSPDVTDLQETGSPQGHCWLSASPGLSVELNINSKGDLDLKYKLEENRVNE